MTKGKAWRRRETAVYSGRDVGWTVCGWPDGAHMWCRDSEASERYIVARHERDFPDATIEPPVFRGLNML